MNDNSVLKAIEELDLEPIKTKLMHVASGEGWSRAKVDAMDIEYRRFLFLMHAFPQEETAPTVDVDTFWHYHILDTMKYAADCEATFGYFLHHYPYVGLDTAEEAGFEERGGDRMRELYEQTFGQAYIRPEAYGMAAAGASAPDLQQAGSQAAYCMYRPDAKALQASDVQQAGSQAAYCMYRPDASRASDVKDVQQAGAKAAYCMYRPDARQAEAPATRDVQEAGAQAAYCMYRPDTKQASTDLAESAAQQPASAPPMETIVARAIMVGTGLAGGAPAAYRVLAAGSRKADIAQMATRTGAHQAEGSAGILAAYMRTTGGAMMLGMPIRPALDLSAA